MVAATGEAQKAEFPFSFVFNGQPSHALLPAWNREYSMRTLDGQRTEHTLTYTHAPSGLQARCAVTEYHDFPAVEWVLYLKNLGESDTPLIEKVLAMDADLPMQKGKCVLHYANGSLCSYNDFAPMTRVVNPKAEIHLAPGGGRSSSEVLPFFNIETDGEGTILAVGWTGEWAFTLARDGEGRLQAQAGMAFTHFRLHPGEEVRSPRILLLFWQNDRLRSQNLLRRFILAHHRPAPGGHPLVVPAFAGNWGGTPAHLHQHNIEQIVAHDLSVEYYWIDAEWFGAPPWWKSAGNWEANQALYPQGFKPLSDVLHSSGRKLLLWFEPERVCRGTPWYRDHEGWLLKIAEDEARWSWPHWVDQDDPTWVIAESHRNQIAEGDALLDLGNPEARRYLTDFISAKITEFGLDCYRHDANIAPLAFWRHADPPDRQGITEIRWIEGLYAFWDELLRRHPHLMIDNCASGGRRIDLETLGRSTAFWRTDFPGPAIAKQCHTYGLLPWVPLNATGDLRLATDSEYEVRSTLSSGLTFGLYTAQQQSIPDDLPFDVAERRLKQYLAIQKYYYGDYYPLTEYSQAQDAWMAYQLDRPDLESGIVVVLKRPLSAYTDATFRLHNLRAEARYEVTNLDSDERTHLSGEELMGNGLAVHLSLQPDSVLILYQHEGG
ncbi:MAG: alpha-galactosidase [Anaerolineae bacterium]|nr:alpha-galactosidase [Anaerolineae bacterium]